MTKAQVRGAALQVGEFAVGVVVAYAAIAAAWAVSPTIWPLLVAAGLVVALAALQLAALHVARVVVVDVGDLSGRAGWRLAELRTHAPTATVVVVGEGPSLPTLAGALQADLAVCSVHDLPPLRELLVASEP